MTVILRILLVNTYQKNSLGMVNSKENMFYVKIANIKEHLREREPTIDW